MAVLIVRTQSAKIVQSVTLSSMEFVWSVWRAVTGTAIVITLQIVRVVQRVTILRAMLAVHFVPLDARNAIQVYVINVSMVTHSTPTVVNWYANHRVQHALQHSRVWHALADINWVGVRALLTQRVRLLRVRSVSMDRFCLLMGNVRLVDCHALSVMLMDSV
jgi:hypothetical protein